MKFALADPTPTLSVLLGLVLPYLMSILKQPKVPPRCVAYTVILLSVGSGLVVTYANGQLNAGNVIGTALAVLAVSQVFYKTIGQQLGLPSWKPQRTWPPLHPRR